MQLECRNCSQHYKPFHLHPSFSFLLISLSSANYNLYPKKFRLRLSTTLDGLTVSERVVTTFLGKTKSFCFIGKKVLEELLKQEALSANKHLIKTSKEIISTETLCGVK